MLFKSIDKMVFKLRDMETYFCLYSSCLSFTEKVKFFLPGFEEWVWISQMEKGEMFYMEKFSNENKVWQLLKSEV